MRRTGDLFERILDPANLRAAYAKAALGKRDRGETRQFQERLDDRLAEMAAGLRSGTFPVGRFQQFVIHDPKERIITAPCFAERVLHHAILGVCEPVFERWLIDDTFACRRGKGRLTALHRAKHFARRFPAYLKLDIRKYFDSIPHAPLLQRLSRLFREQKLLDLFARIIAGFRGAGGVGLPIGSLTSQHFANCYLGTFDRFVKEKLRVRGYVRYMDDMVLWGPSTLELREVAHSCQEFLHDHMHLTVKSEPAINHTVHGLDFLGCRLFPTHLSLNRRSKVRFRRQLVRWEALHAAGMLTELDLQQRMTALVAFTMAGGVSSWRWRSSVLQQISESGHKARTG